MQDTEILLLWYPTLPQNLKHDYDTYKVYKLPLELGTLCPMPKHVLKNYNMNDSWHDRGISVGCTVTVLRCLQSGQQGLCLCAYGCTTWSTPAWTCVTRHCHLHHRPHLWSTSICTWSPAHQVQGLSYCMCALHMCMSEYFLPIMLMLPIMLKLCQHNVHTLT